MTEAQMETRRKPTATAKASLKPDISANPKRTPCILVCSPKGGAGKTSIVRALAVAAAQSGLKVATLDLDRQRTLTQWWSKRPDVGVAQFDHHEGTMADVEEALADMVGYDLIIIDTPPGIEDHRDAMMRLVDRASLALVPTGQHKDDRDSVLAWMGFLRKSGKPAAFLLNRAKKRTRILEEAKAHLIKGGNLCPIVVYDIEDIPVAFESGLTVLDIDKAKGTTEVEGVWHYVRNQLGLPGDDE
jgi:chromosome partitioning protein